MDKILGFYGHFQPQVNQLLNLNLLHSVAVLPKQHQSFFPFETADSSRLEYFAL
jgi:hypothetical protein